MLKRFTGLLAALGVLLIAGVASAHVEISPQKSIASLFERYTLTVPTEKEIPTVKVRVVLPEGAKFDSALAMPGWKFTTEKDAAGNVTALDWSDGKLNPDEFMELGIGIRNPKTPGKSVWKAYQTYADGSVVEWTAPSGDTPAPTVTLRQATAADLANADSDSPAPADSTPSAPAPGTPAPAAATSAAPAPAASSGLGTWLGGAALLIALAALWMAAGAKKRA